MTAANRPSEGIALRCAPGEPSTAAFGTTISEMQNKAIGIKPTGIRNSSWCPTTADDSLRVIGRGNRNQDEARNTATRK